MAAPFDLKDDSVVVVIGTGAGGGVLANELAQKGVSVVALEAGGRYLPEDYVNDEWESFGQLAWLEPRTTSGDWRVVKESTASSGPASTSPRPVMVMRDLIAEQSAAALSSASAGRAAQAMMAAASAVNAFLALIACMGETSGT